MPVAIEKKDTKSRLKVDPEKFKSKVPHLTVVNGVAIVNPEDNQQKKWFEEFKK